MASRRDFSQRLDHASRCSVGHWLAKGFAMSDEVPRQIFGQNFGKNIERGKGFIFFLYFLYGNGSGSHMRWHCVGIIERLFLLRFFLWCPPPLLGQCPCVFASILATHNLGLAPIISQMAVRQCDFSLVNQAGKDLLECHFRAPTTAG